VRSMGNKFQKLGVNKKFSLNKNRTFLFFFSSVQIPLYVKIGGRLLRYHNLEIELRP
jgi:hypothetical protein